MSTYDNPATVVVSTVEVNGGLLMVRRALQDGYGKLALPGGYQVKGETWQEAGARELKEETGVIVNPKNLLLDRVITVEGGINLIFCFHLLKVSQETFTSDAESLEVLVVDKLPDAADVAFTTHMQAVERYFANARVLIAAGFTDD